MVPHPNRSRRSASRITKHKDQYGWRVHVDGRPTSMLVCKSAHAPRYREPAEYFVTTDDDHVLIEASTVSALMSALERLLVELAPAPSYPREATT